MHSRSKSLGWIIGVIAIIAVANALVAGADDVRASGSSTSTFELPLENGRLNLRDVLVKICDELGIQPGQTVQDFDWSIDVQSAVGRVQVQLFDRLTGGVLSLRVKGDRIVATLDRAALEARLAERSRTLERWLAELTGGAKAQKERHFGLTFITADNPRARVSDLSNPPKRAVVLVHGLDDPGFMWNDLIPELQANHYFVARFEYPNDGPIAESADLLAAALSDARLAGIEHVDVVAHSMGGLVTRDVLTRPAYYNGEGGGGDRYPAIDRFIMLGTPNHGSELARLRGVTEIGEHFYRLMTGQDGRAAAIGDGSGEAGVDLLPNSDFLRRLNDRPLATHTRCTIVAGQWIPVGGAEVSSFIEKTRRFAESQEAPVWLREWASEQNEKRAAGMIESTIDGLGDGCVTLDSAKLQGVEDVVVVKANHVGMLLRIGPSKATPPAIPIVLDRLGDSKGGSSPN